MKNSGIGGQAVMEGVMMKNSDKYAVAVRKPDNEIVVEVKDYKSISEKNAFFRIPIVRGVVAFIESLMIGVGTLTYSASFFEEDEENDGKGAKADSKKSQEKSGSTDTIMMIATVCLSVVLAVGIFMLIPYFVSGFIERYIESSWLCALIEGVLRLVLFIGYILVISCMKDIQRVFMYHGAEHKSINCIENGLELTVENVKKQSREHKRCGTSFLLIVMILSVICFMFIRVKTRWLGIVLRLLLVPVIAGVSYEFIKLAGRSESKVVGFLSKPGLALQKLTTREPDASMIEVAIKSVEAVFDWQDFLAHYNEPAGKKRSDEKIAADSDDESEAGSAESSDEQARKTENQSMKSDEQAKKHENQTKKNDEQTKKHENQPKKTGEQVNMSDERTKKSGEQPKKTGEQANKSDERTKKSDEQAGKSDNQPKKADKQVNKSDEQTKKSDEQAGKSDNQPKKADKQANKSGEQSKKTGEQVRKSTDAGRNDFRRPRPVADEEDDEILKALDRFFDSKD